MRALLFRSLAIVAISVFVQIAGPPAANATSNDAAVMGTIGLFVTAVNTGDLAKVRRASAPSVDVVDDFAPHHWRGPHALDAWAAAFAQSLKVAHITEPSIAVAPSKHTQVDGNHAFAPLPTVYRYKQDGKAVKETGVLVFALDRIAGIWKITSMSWAPTP